MTYDALLQETIRNFGQAPRRFGLWEYWTYLHTKPPKWLKSTDQLTVFWENQRRLLTEGEIVWGHIVQANQLMFRPGTANCPGDVLYPRIAHPLVPPPMLEQTAHAIFAWKGTQRDNPVEQHFSDYLAHERIRVYGVEVPEDITPGYSASVSCIFFNREHLPNGRLSKGYFPLLVARDKPNVIMVVPSKYWAVALRMEWLSQGHRDFG